MIAYICAECVRGVHRNCPGGSWCACQHRETKPKPSGGTK